MLPKTPVDIKWLEPWIPLTNSVEALARAEAFVVELRKELSAQHVLHGLQVVAIAECSDSDDVLFATTDPSKPIAVVHLTWTGRTEADPRWPAVAVYRSWQDWIEQGLIPDHNRYTGATGMRTETRAEE
jgi:hypothetical protein